MSATTCSSIIFGERCTRVAVYEIPPGNWQGAVSHGSLCEDCHHAAENKKRRNSVKTTPHDPRLKEGDIVCIMAQWKCSRVVAINALIRNDFKIVRVIRSFFTNE